MKLNLLFLLAAMPCLAFDTDLIFPWVTNNSFQSQLVINNLNPEPVTINLAAIRQDGNTPDQETVADIQIDGLAQWSKSAAELFTTLGEGAGYMVRLTSTADNIQGGFVVRAGSSPAQANVVPANAAATRLLYNYLPASTGGFAAPVVVNMGDATAHVTFYGFINGQEVLSRSGSRITRDVPAGHPHAALVSDLFPEVNGDLMVVAESDQPLLGVAFIFNNIGEPSMANAVPVDSVPGETYALAPAYPVRANGSDWLLYEILVHNRGEAAVNLSTFEILDGETVLETLRGADLAENRLRGFSSIPSQELDLVFLMLQVEPGAVPTRLRNRILLTDGTTRLVETTVKTDDRLVIGPCLRGSNWVAGNGLANNTGHRRAASTFGGCGKIAQRFAIDWIQSNAAGTSSFSGDSTRNENYFAYGEDLLAVADGEVIRIRDGIQENVPQVLPDGVTLDNLAGNFLVLDLGNGHYATYAHIIPGSFNVAVGDRVSRGDVLASLGNSGNSSGPHLHFHMTDQDPGFSGIGAQGIPYVFDNLTIQGRGQVENEVPLNFEVVTFSDN